MKIVSSSRPYLFKVSSPTKTPSTSRARKCRIEMLLKYVFVCICEVKLRLYLKSRQANDLLQIFLENKEPITIARK